MEAAVEGYCALAVSLDRGPESDWQAAADFACSIADSLRGKTSLRGLVVNLNLPAPSRGPPEIIENTPARAFWLQ